MIEINDKTRNAIEKECAARKGLCRDCQYAAVVCYTSELNHLVTSELVSIDHLAYHVAFMRDDREHRGREWEAGDFLMEKALALRGAK
jgi:hypothetical protein